MVSKVHSHLRGSAMRPFEMKEVGDAAVSALSKLGIAITPQAVHDQVKSLYAGDASFAAPVTSASIPTPLQFLQAWLPGFVKIMTAARKIDSAIGITTVGSWQDAEVVQGVLEPMAQAREYGDFTAVPLSSWNANFERRSVVRGELGISVGVLEEERAAAMRVSSAQEKRQAAGIALEIMRNAIGFNGWDSGNNRTYGLLNDPNLPAYGTVAATGTGSATTWSSKNAQNIIADIRVAFQALRSQSKGQIDPETTGTVLLIATDCVDYLSSITDIGISVRDWLTKTYPKCRVESAPELNKASGSSNVFYLYAEEVDSSVDGSTDGGAVFKQLVPTKFRTIGVERRAKNYVEDYSNATAGVLCARPFAVVRFKGI